MAAAPGDYFVIHIVDEQTGRGVPMVELRTTNEIALYSDSSGTVAFFEPGLMSHKVFFTISSPGYEFLADGFGMRGVALNTTPGGKVTLKIKRANIAERLYRLTGAGIYRDTVLAGEPAPARGALLNGDVVGQDSVIAVPYRGRIRWFWGDTSRPDYPLGNFGMSGAVTPLKLDPDRGIDYTYFTDTAGFSRPMMTANGPGPLWINGVSAIENGARLIGYYNRMESLSKVLERGLVVYNDKTDLFDRAARFDADKPLPLDGHPFLAEYERSGAPAARKEVDLIGTLPAMAPLPLIRVRAELSALKDISAYETYTCLKPAWPGAEPIPERDAAGRLVYGWKRGAPALTFELQRKLVSTGALKPEEPLCQLRDVETGKTIWPHTGSVYWNRYRGRWIMIFGQAGGDISNVGEIWFAEADTPVGPWVYARKVATHPKMDFYNPTQHPFLDEEGGRRVYFEGTYVNTFSGNPLAVPRYNYNQLLYRLSLNDPRLALPAPVYRLSSGEHRLRESLKLPADAASIQSIPFYAVPPAAASLQGVIPIYGANGGFQTAPPTRDAKPLFHALPPSKAAVNTIPLKNRAGETIGQVWKNPQSVLTLDFSIKPAANE